ncbi:MAG: class I SAM-dependent methyltransferase [Propionibacterium sp.]|nr:class I SAM-dependent methyltransferase [Propionibacterium sp.]
MADFDLLYRTDPDPFRVGSSWYEQRKIDIVLACLPRPRYRLAWDAAAGTGHLAARLAGRCDRVIATDASTTAITALQAHGFDECFRSTLPALPASAAGADLVIVSEVLYYLTADERAATLAVLAGMTADTVCVQWRHHPHDAQLSGADAQAEFDTAMGAGGHQRLVQHGEPDFLLSVFRAGGV